MDTMRICQGCGKPVGPDAIGGLCPACMVKAGLEGETKLSPGAAASEQKEATDWPPEWVPPAIAELAKYFPYLEIIELLGHGGMGAVYKARHPELDCFVALKILSPKLSRDPAFAERFRREARALARLSHPNIVAVHDFGKAGEFYFLRMEYVDGMNLWQLEQAKKRLPPEEAFAIIPKICDALQYAHEEGVVHRDIKPGNILIDKKGRVKIADFGLARILGQESRNVRLTGSRDVMGTLHYMAPEQLERPQEVDHRADIYSLGVVFYEMLTGELPMGRFDPPSQKVQVDVRLDDVVLRALAKEPKRRYQQASEVKTDVETIASTMEELATRLRGKGVPTRSVPEERKERKLSSRNWILAGASAIIVIGVSTALLLKKHTEAQQTSQTSAIITVSGQCNPWLAGMPDGSRADGGDVAPNQSPAYVTGIPIEAGRILTFNATGLVQVVKGRTPPWPPHGSPWMDTHHAGAENGISSATMPQNALAGVFLGSDIPNITVAPETTDFSSEASRNFSILRPVLKQVFFIGDGRSSAGELQRFVIPAGATRLFLGTMDGWGWNDNQGSFTVLVSSLPAALEATPAESFAPASSHNTSASASASTILYQTSFEASEGYIVGQPLVGQQGWAGPNAPGNGVSAGLLSTSGQQAFLGGIPGRESETNRWSVRWITADRINSAFASLKGQVLEISWDQLISDSTNGINNGFRWIFMDSQSKWVAGLAFEIDGSVQRLPGSADTGVRIKHGQLYPVKMRFDFPQNRWTATIGTNSLPSVPISPANPAVGLSQMNIDWFCGDGLWGDNRLVFDNLKVATLPRQGTNLRRPIRL